MSLISKKRVPNQYRKEAKILIIGEAPGSKEEDELKPFVGDSGELLELCLAQIKVSRSDVSLANLCQYRPHDNKFEYLESSDELRTGLQELKSYIQEQRSTLRVIILLGERPLQYLGERYGISKWRGSVIDLFGVNTVSTYHPAYVLRDRTVYPIFTFDLEKAYSISVKGYTKPRNDFTYDPRGLELEECIHAIINNKIVSCDIESKKDSSHIRCVGFGLSNNRAICLANHSYAGMDITFFDSLRRIFESDIKLVFHNALFDVPMLGINGLKVKEYFFDTMIAQHVMEPEMPKTLAFLTSLYTDRPYYKGMVKDDDEKGWNDKIDKDTLHEYNCIDCVATYEIYTKQTLELSDRKQLEYFNYRLSLCEVAQHISDTGMLVDEDRILELKEILEARWKEDQTLLNAIAGYQVNVKSGPQMKKLLYDDLKLPVRKSYSGSITTDEDAIVSLMSSTKDTLSTYRTEEKIFEWTKKLVALKLTLRIREWRQLLSNYIHATRSPDKRIRSSIGVAATETGRFNAKAYVDGTGINNMTMPRAVIKIEVKEDEKK